MSFIVNLEENFSALITGKTDFNGFLAGEGAQIEKGISELAAPLQVGANILYESFKAGASALVGVGETSLGPILAQSPATDSAEILNLLSSMGVPFTGGAMGIAEQAALTTAITGLKAMLDRMGLHIMTANYATPGSAPAPAPNPAPAPAVVAAPPAA